jgi:iron complex outermembrane receptor protein
MPLIDYRCYTLLLILCCDAGYAADYSNETDYYQELPVVLSASRLSQPLSEAPNAMTVIDRKMITDSGFRSLPELFKLVPGMYVSYYKGGQAFVSYHGSTDQYARRMQVLIDGRSVYMSPMSMVDWTDLPITLDDIERIEVIRGPAAASYGANSTQGVISITTRDAGAADGKTLSVTRGSKGVNDVSARFGRHGEQLDYRMTVAYTADNGYDNLPVPPNNYPITKFQAPGLINNSFDSNQTRLVNYRADYHPNGIDRFDVQFGFNHNVKNVGWTDSAANPVHNLFANAGFMQLEWVRVLENAAEFSLRYAHIRHDQHETFVTTLLPQAIAQQVRTQRDEIEVQHTLPLSPFNRLVYGAAYRRDQTNGQYSTLAPIAPAYASALSIDEWRLFAHDEWRITPRLLLNTGGMLERNGFGNRKLSPRIAVNFHATPQQTFRAGISVAYRTPSLMERNMPAVQPGELFVVSAIPISPGLMPERLISREIGYLGEFRDWNTTLDLRLFSDLLVNGMFQRAGGAFINGMSGEYRGFEASVKHAFSEDSDVTVNLAHELASSNGAVMGAAGYNTLRSVCPWNNDALSCSTPRNSASLLYSQRLPHDYSFSTSYYYQAAMQPFDRGTIDFQQTQRRLDARIAKAFNQGGAAKAEVALVLQNLLDTRYTEYVANNVFNRRGYVTLTLNW